jgi:hypothetical protein
MIMLQGRSDDALLPPPALTSLLKLSLSLLFTPPPSNSLSSASGDLAPILYGFSLYGAGLHLDPNSQPEMPT